MKKIIALALALCMLPGSVCAVAEEAAYYVPGQLTQTLFSDALAAGKLITGDLSFAVDYTEGEPDTSEFDAIIAAMDEELAQATASGDEEQAELIRQTLDSYTAYADSVRREAKMRQAFYALLGQAHLQIGAAYPEDAHARLTLGASLDNPKGGDPVRVDAALDLDWSGMSVESDLFPGQRVTLQWDTLLRELGLTGNMLRYLREREPGTMLDMNAMLAKLEAIADKLTVYVAPYAAIAMQQMISWTTDVQTDVPAQDGMPAAAVLTTVSYTSEDIRNMLLAMVDYLETDDNLIPYLDRCFTYCALFTDRDIGEVKAQFFANLREAVITSTQGNVSCTDTIALDSANLPIYVHMQIDDADSGESLALTYSAVEYGSDAATLTFDIAFTDSDGAQDAVNTTFTVASPPDDPVLELPMQITAAVDVIASGRPTGSALYEVSYLGALTEDGLPCATTSTSQVLTQTQYLPEEFIQFLATEDLEGFDPNEPLYTMAISSCKSATSALTADGGESIISDYTYGTVIDDESLYALPVHAEKRFAPDGNDGVSGEMTVMMDFSQKAALSPDAPSPGLNAIGCTITVTSEDFDAAASAALEPFALDDATDEQLSILLQTITVTGLSKLARAMAVLPPEFSALLMRQ